jgi:dynein heavy chain
MIRILGIVRKTFSDIIDAVDGSIIMTPDIVDSIDSLFDGGVPGTWLRDASGAEISWIKPSFPLWFASLLERNLQLTNWLKNERPKTFSLAGFFNPQGFLTAMKQEVVRLNKASKAHPGQKGGGAENWSMELVDYHTSVLSERAQREMENVRDPPGEGVYVHGLFLEGCKWKRDSLDEATEKKMTYPLNILHVSASTTSSKRGSDQERRENHYNCPVYKYPTKTDRYLVFRVLLPCVGGSTDASKWKMRGVSLLCSTD